MMGFQFKYYNIINPATFEGAVVYAIVFLIGALVLNRMLSLAVQRALARGSRVHIDRTRVNFISQLAQIIIYIVAFFVYARHIPALANLGSAGLASVGVLSVVAGLAAQNTLGNLIAGISLLLYRPFNVGDRLQDSLTILGVPAFVLPLPGIAPASVEGADALCGGTGDKDMHVVAEWQDVHVLVAFFSKVIASCAARSARVWYSGRPKLMSAAGSG